MISKFLRRTIVATGILLSLNSVASAQNTPGFPPMPQVPKTLPFVSAIFGDNMVLQRGKTNEIWGWSEPGDKIQVQIGNTTASTIAGADRRWEVKFDPPPMGGPYTIKITGPQTVELNDVLVGDVWLCGGQSNMGLPLRFARTGAEDAKTANFREIRFFSVVGNPAYRHTDLIGGKWSVLTPDSAGWDSAVGFYFARKLEQEMHVPLGLVVDAVGGTPAESWASAEALRPLHDFDVPLAEVERLGATDAPQYGNFVMHWYDEYDIGIKGKWATPEFDDSAWKAVKIPGGFAELGVPTEPALMWFRKDVVLPDPLPPGRTVLYLGSIERMDTVYVNGTEVGGSSWVENPRVYFLNRAIKPGHNTIAIRVLKTKPDGGFLGKPEELHLTLGDNSTIPMAGEWKAKVSVDARPPMQLPIAYENWPVMPTVLYEGMLRPVAPLAITGAIWYQGEQNSPRGYQYRKLLPAMVADWRKLFGQGDFPLYIVGLPAFKARSAVPVTGDEWTETRESQAIAAATIPNSCLAETIDTGDPNNIHAADKQPVGERLALCALANQYGKKVVFAGPMFVSADPLPGSIRIHFTHIDGGLIVKGEKLAEFSVAGQDHTWHWADARIEGDTVVVSSPDVPNPQEVRYAWQSNPAATLYNGAGLPAVPFRTDTWPGMTDSHRPY
jgi:sialate O-acetylesterase